MIERHPIASYAHGCYVTSMSKNQIKGILKISYRFITSWQLHSNDFRLQSVVDLRCHEYVFCLFDTQTHVVFLLF